MDAPSNQPLRAPGEEALLGSYPLALNRLRDRPWVEASPENFVIFHIFPGAAWW